MKVERITAPAIAKICVFIEFSFSDPDGPISDSGP
jgi:hypothetical protein